MCDIIINTFYLSDKILSNKYIYDIKRKLQLKTNVGVGIHVTPFLKTVNISKSFCSFKVSFKNAIYDASKLLLTL